MEICLDLWDQAVRHVGVTFIQQLADDQLVKVLAVPKCRFGTKHLGSGFNGTITTWLQWIKTWSALVAINNVFIIDFYS